MKVMDLKTFALKLKQKLRENPSASEAKEIAKRINSVKHINGTLLTEKEIWIILNHLRHEGYDHKAGQVYIIKEDNSAWLNLVAIVEDNVNKE